MKHDEISNEIASYESQLRMLQKFLEQDEEGSFSYESNQAGIESVREKLLELQQELARVPQPTPNHSSEVLDIFFANDQIDRSQGLALDVARDCLDNIFLLSKAVQTAQEKRARHSKKVPVAPSRVLAATVHGSFGFRVRETVEDIVAPNAVACGSIAPLGEIFRALAAEEETAEEFLGEQPKRVRSAVSAFVAGAANLGMAVRTVSPAGTSALSVERVGVIRDMLEREPTESVLRVHGRLLSITTVNRKRFEAEQDESDGSPQSKLSGPVWRHIAYEDADRAQRSLQQQTGLLVIQRIEYPNKVSSRAIHYLLGFKPDNPALEPFGFVEPPMWDDERDPN